MSTGSCFCKAEIGDLTARLVRLSRCWLLYELARGNGVIESRSRNGSWARAAAVLGAYLVFRWTLGVVRLPHATPAALLFVAACVSAAGAIGLPILGIAELVRRRISVLGALALVVAGLGLWFGTAAIGRGWGAPVAGALQDLGKILAASGLGIALAAGIKEPNILLPAGVFAAFADFVVVNFGTVKHALSSSKGQQLVQAVSAQVPAVHARLPMLTIGPADFLFLGIFLACAARFEMGLSKTAAVLAAVLALSLILVPIIGPIPALAPMSIAFVVVNWRHFRLTRQEIVSTFAVLGVMGLLFVGYFLWVFPRTVKQ